MKKSLLLVSPLLFTGAAQALDISCPPGTVCTYAKNTSGGVSIVPPWEKVLVSPTVYYRSSRIVTSYTLTTSAASTTTTTAAAPSSSKLSGAPALTSSDLSLAKAKHGGDDQGENNDDQGDDGDDHEGSAGSSDGIKFTPEPGATYIISIAKVDGTSGATITGTCGQTCPDQDSRELGGRTGAAPAASATATPVAVKKVGK